jgi:SAM-dependent methyltransferase
VDGLEIGAQALMADQTDQREVAPAAERNKQAILEVLARVLPSSGLVLEIGSGTGQHVAHFAKALPGLTFQPSEMDVGKHASIAAWVKHEGVSNVRAPVALDVMHTPWPIHAADAIVCTNVIHISPWEVTLALMHHASEVLRPGGVLVTYGPYKREGKHTAPSNETFDAWLKERDKRFGVRDMGEVAMVAMEAGFVPEDVVEMPANNFVLVFRQPFGAA